METGRFRCNVSSPQRHQRGPPTPSPGRTRVALGPLSAQEEDITLALMGLIVASSGLGGAGDVDVHWLSREVEGTALPQFITQRSLSPRGAGQADRERCFPAAPYRTQYQTWDIKMEGRPSK